MAAIGLLLAYGPEFAYLRDNFGTRMNTIFKFYYQSWLLFALVTAYVAGIALRRGSRSGLAVTGLAGVSVALVAAGLVFPAASVYSKTVGFSSPGLTLDTGGYLARTVPDVDAAVRWVRANTTPDALVLQGVGDSYHPDENRISTWTGRSTLLGWEGHERQWRGEAYDRMADGRSDVVALIYARGTAPEVADAVAKWGIDYVYVGPFEVQQYGITPARMAVLEQALMPVFASGDVRIFRRP